LKIGLFDPLFAGLSLAEMLEELTKFPQITALEIGCGGWPGNTHIDVDALLLDDTLAKQYVDRLAAAGLTISALSCHGNPVHPVQSIAKRDQEIYERTIRLAERLYVDTVVTFSGCPGAHPDDRSPNWIIAAWPPEIREALDWQWDEKLIPYWKQAERFASDHGVKIAIEAHPGFCVYNPETLLRLRQATGPALGINFDPSHLWWQGIDPVLAIRSLQGAIFHFHAKDVAIDSANAARNGVLDSKNYDTVLERSWTFRTVGWGHSETEWKSIVSALRLAGYDGALSIEHEDSLLSIREGLTSAINMLSRVVLNEPPVKPWWT
jgi:sugar phosphate isomerase/epimerase